MMDIFNGTSMLQDAAYALVQCVEASEAFISYACLVIPQRIKVVDRGCRIKEGA
jgi:hypothetical protein